MQGAAAGRSLGRPPSSPRVRTPGRLLAAAAACIHPSHALQRRPCMAFDLMGALAGVLLCSHRRLLYHTVYNVDTFHSNCCGVVSRMDACLLPRCKVGATQDVGTASTSLYAMPVAATAAHAAFAVQTHARSTCPLQNSCKGCTLHTTPSARTIHTENTAPQAAHSGHETFKPTDLHSTPPTDIIHLALPCLLAR